MLTSSASVDHLFLIRKIYEACNGKIQLRVMMYVAFPIIGEQPKIIIGYYFNAVKLLPCQHGQSLKGCAYMMEARMCKEARIVDLALGPLSVMSEEGSLNKVRTDLA